MSGLFVGTAAERREHADNCRQAIDVAAFVGSPIIRVFCSTIPEKNGDGDDPWPAMIDGIGGWPSTRPPRGSAVGLQNHPSTGDDMLRIRGEVDRENFGFVMDSGQWVGSPGSHPCGETSSDIDFYRFMEQTAPHALYIRTKFYKIESGREEWIDYERIVRIIKDVGYNGCISIVYEGEQEDRVEQVRLAANYLRELLV